jgi:hypothetical protein
MIMKLVVVIGIRDEKRRTPPPLHPVNPVAAAENAKDKVNE